MLQTGLAEVLAEYSLDALMSENVLTVYEGWSVKRLAGFFVKHGISGAPVIASDEELVGVVTQSDVVRFESSKPSEAEMQKLVQFYVGPFGGDLSPDILKHLKEKASENCTVNAIMTPEVVSVDVSTPVVEACDLIVNQGIHRLFVTRSGRLAGVVTARDILKRLLKGE